MKNKKIIIALGLVFIIGIYFLFISNNDDDLNIAEVVYGDIVNEIFETGVIKKGEEINLSFISGGKIEFVNVSEGESVEKGVNLIKLETSELQIQLNKAMAGLEIAEANYDKLISGASNEDIKIIEESLLGAQKDLSSSKSNLDKIEKTSEERINKIYGDSLSLLNEIIIKGNSAYDTIDEISKIYFTKFSTEEARRAIRMRDNIGYNLDNIKENRELLRLNSDYKNIDKNLSDVEESLKDIFESIDVISSIFDEPIYRNASKRDTDAVINQKTIINQLMGSLTSLIKSASLTNSTNQVEINAAESQVISAQNRVNSLSLELDKIKSPAKENDLRQARARASQAKSEIELLKKSINNSTIKAPIKGTVLEINAKQNEIIQAGVPVITFIPESDYQVEVNIYEGDISNIEIGNKTKIEIVAFPDKIFNGEIIFIDSSSRIIDGVVYYKTLISLNDYPENIRSDMSVDVTIKTDERNNVLIVPERAIRREGGRSYVKIIENGTTVEAEVDLGIRGEGRMIEVISGLREGQKILID